MANTVYSTWGRTRRPKNILGEDGTTISAANGNPMEHDVDPTDDIVSSISTATLDTNGRQLTLEVANNAFDAVVVGSIVKTRGLSSRVDDTPLTVISRDADTNTVVVETPKHLNVNEARNLLVSNRGQLVQQTTSGYRTENARFLHLLIKNAAGNARTVTVYAYNYAFGVWTPLQIPSGAGATSTANYVDAAFIVNANTRMLTLPINGVDRVYFQCGATDANVTLSAAITTF